MLPPFAKQLVNVFVEKGDSVATLIQEVQRITRVKQTFTDIAHTLENSQRLQAESQKACQLRIASASQKLWDESHKVRKDSKRLRNRTPRGS